MCELCDNNITGGAVEDVIRARISLHGWTVMGLRDGGFAYAVGLSERGWSELVMRGISLEGAGGLLVGLVSVFEQTQPPAAGRRIVLAPEADPDSGITVRLDAYPGPKRDLPYARKLYGGGFSALDVRPESVRFSSVN